MESFNRGEHVVAAFIDVGQRNKTNRQNSKSQFADDTALWAASKTYNLQPNFCIRTYKNWQNGVPNGE